MNGQAYPLGWRTHRRVAAVVILGVALVSLLLLFPKPGRSGGPVPLPPKAEYGDKVLHVVSVQLAADGQQTMELWWEQHSGRARQVVRQQGTIAQDAVCDGITTTVVNDGSALIRRSHGDRSECLAALNSPFMFPTQALESGRLAVKGPIVVDGYDALETQLSGDPPTQIILEAKSFLPLAASTVEGGPIKWQYQIAEVLPTVPEAMWTAGTAGGGTRSGTATDESYGEVDPSSVAGRPDFPYVQPLPGYTLVRAFTYLSRSDSKVLADNRYVIYEGSGGAEVQLILDRAAPKLPPSDSPGTRSWLTSGGLAMVISSDPSLLDQWVRALQSRRGFEPVPAG